MLTVTYAECHIKAPYAERLYSECRYAERRYAECRGTLFTVMLIVVAPMTMFLNIKKL